MLRKLAGWINREVIHSEIVVYNLVFLAGAIIFNLLINNKIGGKYWGLILVGSYFILGLSLYKILKWLVINGFKLLVFLVRLVLWGNIEMTVVKGNVFFKTYFKK